MASNALGYNKVDYKKKVQGLATIKAGKDKVRITFFEKEGATLEFDNGEMSKVFTFKELPKFPVIPTNSEDTYFVKLNNDGDEVESISPADGVYTAQVMDMSRPEKDADPAPYEITPRDPKFPAYLAFNVYWKIIEGDFKGCVLNQFFHYSGGSDKPYFAENAENKGYTNWGMPVTDKAKWLPLLQDFCLKTDCVGEPIEWPEDGNVLPELLSRILSNKKKIKLFVKDGYVKELTNSGERQTRIVTDDELDEPTPKSKKTTVSKAKPVAKKSVKKNTDEDL
jgi:hypothetical protein